jgi:putative tRNA adenosine deaminase-associated protein
VAFWVHAGAPACDHSQVSTRQVDARTVDFAVAAFREEGRWTVSVLPARVATSCASFLAALRQLPGEGGVFGFVGVEDDFFLAVREAAGRTRGFISDAMAIDDWSLAGELAEVLDLDIEDDELDEYLAIGDLSIFADFGLAASEVELVCEDTELYPDEQVRSIAKRLGFEAELASALRGR